MSYDAIMDKAEAVRDAAIDAALIEQTEWRMDGHDLDEADADSYKTEPTAWPADPMDTDIIWSIPSKFVWLAVRLLGPAGDADAALKAMSWTMASTPDIGIAEQQDRLHEFRLRHDSTDDTISLLNSYGSGDSAVGLSLLSTVLGIAAIPATGGTSAGFALLSALSGGASALAGEDGPDLTVSGSHVKTKLESMFAALEDVQEHLEEREDEVDEGLRSDLKMLQDTAGENSFWETIVPGSVTIDVRMRDAT